MFTKNFKRFFSRQFEWLAVYFFMLLLVPSVNGQHAYNVWRNHGPSSGVYSLEVAPSSPNTIIAPAGDYYWDGLNIFKSSNHGVNWTPVTPAGGYPDWIGPAAFDPADAQTFYVYKYVPQQDMVFKTTDGGQNWTLIFTQWVNHIKVAPNDRNTIYMIGTALYVSTNGGASWTTRQLPTAPGSEYGSLTVHPNDPNTIFVAGGNPFIYGSNYKSTDGGQSWSQVNLPAPAAILFDPRNSDIVYAYGAVNGLRKSLDGGATWTLIPTPYPPTALALDIKRNTLYIAVELYGVYRSGDGGASWQPYSDGLFATDDNYNYVYSLVMPRNGDILYAGTEWGVFTVRVAKKAPADFDGDGRSDVGVFRPADSVWYLNRSTVGFAAVQFGLPADKLAPADYDNDGKTDLATFRDGTWYWLNSSDNSFNALQFGAAGDVPVPADYTGDGRAELAVYRGGAWWSLDLTNFQAALIRFGLPGDIPLPADYDNDGRADRAVYRHGEWHLNLSAQGYRVIHFGLATDIPVIGDYDGDGKTDQAVYRGGEWHLLGSQSGYSVVDWGLSGDVPVPADYDGDGRTDAAIFRDGAWWIRQSSSGISVQQFGLSGDMPVAAGTQ